MLIQQRGFFNFENPGDVRRHGLAFHSASYVAMMTAPPLSKQTQTFDHSFVSHTIDDFKVLLDITMLGRKLPRSHLPRLNIFVDGNNGIDRFCSTWFWK
jgi:hypothetical protein